MKTQAIIPMAGLGTRMNQARPKPLIFLGGKPLFIYCLEAMEASEHVESVICVASKENIDEFNAIISESHLAKVKAVVEGGEHRSDSVYNGLKHTDEDTDIVCIHDGARPLVSSQLVDELIEICYKEEAVIAATPVKPTIKTVDLSTLTVKETLDRNQLWEVQTPQIFKKSTLLKAHEQKQDSSASDDALLVEQLGVAVKVFKSDYRNIKITTPEDLIIAQGLLAYEN